LWSGWHAFLNLVGNLTNHQQLKLIGMKRITLNIFVLAGLFLAASCGNKEKDSKEVAEEMNEQTFEGTSMDDDTEFAVKAADGGMLEVKLAELAQIKSSSKAVKDMAQTIVADHEKANSELKTLADKKNIVLPAGLSDEKQKDFDKLAEKTGTDFDKAYSEYMVKDHKEDIDAFKEAATDSKDPDLKEWAAGKVPTLEHHLEMAKMVEKSVKN
jgi:putative membrane protein